MKNILILITFITFITLTKVCLAEPKTRLYYEKDYQKYWCSENCGKVEFILPDKARVDCVTDKYAVEFDFANKWSESVGQVLYYSKILNKLPAIVLIIENEQKDIKYLKRLETVCNSVNIKLFTIYPKDLLTLTNKIQK